MDVISPWIQTSNRCNLKCPYCYINQSEKKMTKETYNKINEIFLGLLNDNKVDSVIYRLAGGEPFLLFDEWKEFGEVFLNKNNSKGKLGILTNLTILNDDHIEFLRKYKNQISLSISLDGYNYSKPNVNGESTAEVVRKNIEKLLNAGVRRIGISTVINDRSFDNNDIEQLSTWIAERNLPWNIGLNHFYKGEIPAELICSKIKQVIQNLSSHNFDLYHMFKFNNLNLDCTYEGCTAGEKLLAIGVDGSIYPCQTLLNSQPICNIFDNVDIMQELKKQKIYNLGCNYIIPEKCKNCALLETCKGGCKLHNNRKYTCDIIKKVSLFLIKEILKKESEE